EAVSAENETKATREQLVEETDPTLNSENSKTPVSENSPKCGDSEDKNDDSKNVVHVSGGDSLENHSSLDRKRDMKEPEHGEQSSEAQSKAESTNSQDKNSSPKISKSNFFTA
ncbi:Hypothetical predicted protein, partial [Paramuricea clavata]